MPELKLYTVAQLRNWLVNNKPAEGLSERIIAPTRAWAIIHNPYVREDDAIVAAIFVDGQLAAYTASFPDWLDGKRVWWASTLYCYPQFSGRGYGMIVVGSLIEAHEPELTYDRWGAQETMEIFNHFGYQTSYTPRYILSDKEISANSFKGKLAYCMQELKKCMHPWPKASNVDYILRYASYIDGEAYAFMQEYRGTDLWLREQSLLNWILLYPFRQGCIMLNRVEKDTEFSSNYASFERKLVKVYDKKQLVGVYLLRLCGDMLAIDYFYCVGEHKKQVFASIVDHIIVYKPHSFVTERGDLFVYVRDQLYFPKKHEDKVSLSLPDNSISISNFTLQLGDGDSFA